MYDALGSIGVGAMLGGVSCFLIRKNLNLLGQPVPARTEEVADVLLRVIALTERVAAGDCTHGG